MNYTGHIHNAAKCTIDGRDLFIASVHAGGVYRATLRECWDSTREFGNVTEARAYLKALLRCLGEREPVIEVKL